MHYTAHVRGCQNKTLRAANTPSSGFVFVLFFHLLIFPAIYFDGTTYSVWMLLFSGRPGSALSGCARMAVARAGTAVLAGGPGAASPINNMPTNRPTKAIHLVTTVTLLSSGYVCKVPRIEPVMRTLFLIPSTISRIRCRRYDARHVCCTDRCSPIFPVCCYSADSVLSLACFGL